MMLLGALKQRKTLLVFLFLCSFLVKIGISEMNGNIGTIKFHIRNNCKFEVWPAIKAEVGQKQATSSGFKLGPAGDSKNVIVPALWSGRVWGRTDCTEDHGIFFWCMTGDCGTSSVECAAGNFSEGTTIVTLTLNGSSSYYSKNTTLLSLPIYVTESDEETYKFDFCSPPSGHDSINNHNSTSPARNGSVANHEYLTTLLITRNRCNSTVWPAIVTDDGSLAASNSGFELMAGELKNVSIPIPWSGSVWGRTNCTAGKYFSCAVGDCGTSSIECGGGNVSSQTTLAHFALNSQHSYTVSKVGLPMTVNESGGGDYQITFCPSDELGNAHKSEIRRGIVIGIPSAVVIVIIIAIIACKVFPVFCRPNNINIGSVQNLQMITNNNSNTVTMCSNCFRCMSM